MKYQELKKKILSNIHLEPILVDEFKILFEKYELEYSKNLSPIDTVIGFQQFSDFRGKMIKIYHNNCENFSITDFSRIKFNAIGVKFLCYSGIFKYIKYDEINTIEEFIINYPNA